MKYNLYGKLAVDNTCQIRGFDAIVNGKTHYFIQWLALDNDVVKPDPNYPIPGWQPWIEYANEITFLMEWNEKIGNFADFDFTS